MESNLKAVLNGNSAYTSAWRNKREAEDDLGEAESVLLNHLDRWTHEVVEVSLKGGVRTSHPRNIESSRRSAREQKKYRTILPGLGRSYRGMVKAFGVDQGKGGYIVLGSRGDKYEYIFYLSEIDTKTFRVIPEEELAEAEV